ncbi:MAG: flippase [Candidatus Kerfeldbacteria bacterium]|nr:flippase [Candidatus Kerfeldbacteria bacterium]
MPVPSVKRNAAILISTEFATRFLMYFVVVALMNYLGDDRYGQLAYLFAIANLCIVGADFGIHTYVTRLLAKSYEQWLTQRAGIITLKLIGSAMAWLLTVTIVLPTSQLSPTIIVAGTLAIVLASGRMFSEAVARGRQQMQLEGISKSVHITIQAVALIIALSVQATLTSIAIVYAGAAIIGWLVSVWLVRQPLLHAQPAASVPIRTIWLAVLPFAASVAINAQFNYFDSAVLGWLHPKEVVAWYTAAYKPIFFLTALAGLIISAFFPRIVELWTTQDRAGVRQALRRLLTIALAAGLPMAIIGSWLAPYLFAWLYAPEYAPGVIPFTILLWSTLGIFIWAPLGNTLQACGYEKLYTKNFIIGAALNLPLTIGLIWWYGMIGAAVATAITQYSLCILMYRDVRKTIWSA